MIKESQEKYLTSLPDGEIIEISPFDPRVREVGEKIIAEIKEVLPDLPTRFGGAAALGIAGQNDIDILMLSTPTEFERYFSELEKLFGQPSRIGTSPKNKSIKWEFVRNDFPVELYMVLEGSPAAEEQNKTFELLSQNKELREAYEQIKLPYGKIDLKEYLRKKYDFFNQILENK